MSANRKSGRQRAVVRLIKKTRIGTQSELCEALRAAGFECDQATVSRDIKELGLVKAVGDGGHAYYARVDDIAPVARAPKVGLLKQYVKSIDGSGNLVVVKGGPGLGPAIGQMLDHLSVDGIIGTVAGDDTVMAVVREGASGRKVAQLLRKEIGLE